MKLVAPITYQGGKQRIASTILDIINPDPQLPFHDLCCGSGAISIELVNRGFPVQGITMVDLGPWGLFWQAIGNGSFDMKELTRYCKLIPQDRSLTKRFLEDLSKQPSHIDTIYVFLLLQSGSFGSKAIWTENDRWRNCSFRSYWLPTATSNRRSPVNPMMPMPETLLSRISEICHAMQGIRGLCCDVRTVNPTTGTVYIDPPYAGTTFYGYQFDVPEYAKGLKTKSFISEGKELSALAHLVSTARRKGGISGDRQATPQAEWLSVFDPIS